MHINEANHAHQTKVALSYDSAQNILYHWRVLIKSEIRLDTKWPIDMKGFFVQLQKEHDQNE